MSNEKMTEQRIETPEEREKRLRRQRMRRNKKRKRRRKVIMIRACICAILGVIFFGLIWLIASGWNRAEDRENTDSNEQQEEQAVMENVELTDVLFLSFSSLIADTEQAFSQEDVQMAQRLDYGHLTVGEFERILLQLYQQDYVLVHLKDLVAVDEKGAVQEKELLLEQGKKPLIICQQNVSYEFEISGQGLASRLVVNENGEIQCEKINADGSTSVGNYDVIPCLNAFIREHPDFAKDNARGIIGLTGYNGILGYRTTSTLAATEGNIYAAEYGLFDTAAEIENVKPIVEALHQEGWEFACNGYAFLSYNGNLEDVKEDMEQWQTEVGSLVGEVDILLYPNGMDIGNWEKYAKDDAVYSFLKEQGFRYFCNLDITGNWGQITEDYLRISYRNLDGYRMYQEVYRDGDRFENIFNFEGIMDASRPCVIAETVEDSGGA